MTNRDKEKFYIELGELICSARKRLGLSQHKLSQLISMSRASVINIEKGRQHPPVHLLWTLAQTLEVPIIDLIPDFSSSEDEFEINDFFEKIIKKTTKKGIIKEDSLKKINTFISNS